MPIKAGIALIAAAAIAMTWAAGAAATVSSHAKPISVTTLSADKDKKKDHKKGGGQNKKGGGQKAKNGGGKMGDGKKKDGSKQFKLGGGDKGKKKNGGKQFKSGGGDNGKKKNGGKQFKLGGGNKGGKATAKRMRGLSHGHGEFAVRGRNFSTWRGAGYRAHNHTFVALSALAAILIGGERYYPYAYISAPEDYCEGFTEDGCQLHWREVETIDGDTIGQCVAYCPWED